MSQPGRFGAGWAPDESALIRRIEDLERRVREGFAARTLEASSIGAGGLQVINEGSIIVKDGGTVRVEDASGGRAVTLGLLSDSSFGMSVNDPISGAELPLSQIAFGLTAVSDTAAVAGGTKAIWTADGLTATFTCATGRAIVIVGATIAMGTPTGVDIAQAYYGYSLAGPTPLAQSINRAVHTEFGSFVFQGTSMQVHTGLTAGTYTIAGYTMRTTTGSNAVPTVSTGNRSLIVLPY